MIKEKNPPILTIKPKDDLEQREKDFEEIFNLNIMECGIFKTVNIKAFRTALSNRSGDKKFSIKHKEGQEYRIWRIK